MRNAWVSHGVCRSHFLELDDVGPFDSSSKLIGIVFGIPDGLGEFQLRLNIFVLRFDFFLALDHSAAR